MKKVLSLFLGSPMIGATGGKTLLFLWLKRDLKMRKEISKIENETISKSIKKIAWLNY